MVLSLVWNSLAEATKAGSADTGSTISKSSSATELASIEAVRQQLLSTVGSQTTPESSQSLNIEGGHVSIERLYPHVYDESAESGQALLYVQSALSDVHAALDDYSNADLPAISTRLSQVAAAMNKAHPLTYFNESFGAVISFIRRATLIANSSDVSLPSLNALLSALRALSSNPMLDLDKASEIVEELSLLGWNGEHAVGGEILAALLSDTDLEHEQVQALLFPS